jgi:hypothetical protein
MSRVVILLEIFPGKKRQLPKQSIGRIKQGDFNAKEMDRDPNGVGAGSFDSFDSIFLR